MGIVGKLVFAFLILSLVPLAVTGLVIYGITYNVHREQILNQMDSIAEIQKERILTLFKLERERLAAVTSRILLQQNLDLYLNSHRRESQEEMNQVLFNVLVINRSYKEISVLSLAGKVLASTNKKEIGADRSTETFFVLGREHVRVDLTYLDEQGRLMNYLVGPIYYKNNERGVVVIKEEADNLIALVSDYTGLGNTGETLLGRRDKGGDILIITPLRFNKNAAMRMAISAGDMQNPIISAFEKRSSLVLDGIDYRGIPVIAATRYIPEAGWGLVVKIDEDEALYGMRHLRVIFIVIFVISAALIACASWLVARSLTRPIVNLTLAAEGIRGGRLDERAQITRKDEIGTLARVFNSMAENLIAANKSLEEKVRELKREIKSRSRAELQVVETTKKLVDANEDLQSFAYTVSHDLRAPLRAMQGFSQALLEDYGDSLDKEGKRYAQRIVGAAEKLDRLIQDLLAYSRLSRAEMEMKHLGLGDVVGSVLKEMEGEIARKKGDVAVSDIPSSVIGSEQILKQVVTNLLINALIFVDKGTRPLVRIWSRENEGHVDLFVEDNGIGIPEEYHNRIFRVFERLHGSETYPGTGIGLAIVKMGMERMGGSCGLTSVPGRGSVFYIRMKGVLQEENHNRQDGP